MSWPTFGMREKERNFASMTMRDDGQPRYYLGLDLGQAKDFTALVILEKHGADKHTAQYRARHLQRYELGTSYPAIVADVAKLLRQGVFQNKHPTLAIDGTGVGAPVVDLFKKERLPATLRPIIITGGDQVTREAGVTRVPKRDLVGVVQVMLQTARLKIAAELPEAATLTRELQDFQVKITDAANDTYGAWREGTHDDLVLALALALWTGQNDGAAVTAFTIAW
jgi:hypothetical protein